MSSTGPPDARRSVPERSSHLRLAAQGTTWAVDHPAEPAADRSRGARDLQHLVGQRSR